MMPEEFESRIKKIVGEEQVRLSKVAGEKLSKLVNDINDVPHEVGEELEKYGRMLEQAFELKEILGVERVLDIMENGGTISTCVIDRSNLRGRRDFEYLLEMVVETEDFRRDDMCDRVSSNFASLKVTVIVEPMMEE